MSILFDEEPRPVTGVRFFFSLQVEYRRGEAVLLESDVRCLSDSNAMLTCLQTKWPSIDVRWPAGVPPSIN